MGTRLTKAAFESLIEGDIAWLKGHPHSVERMHILAVLEGASDMCYPREGMTNQQGTALALIDEAISQNEHGNREVVQSKLIQARLVLMHGLPTRA